jgi:retron-type reverse transcriptase
VLSKLMGNESPLVKGHLKVELSAHCWRICIFTWGSTGGCKHFPYIPFERYADDIVVHTRSKAQAEFIKQRITARMEECSLQLHPEKTHIVYCKDQRRRENQSQQAFTFWVTRSVLAYVIPCRDGNCCMYLV